MKNGGREYAYKYSLIKFGLVQGTVQYMLVDVCWNALSTLHWQPLDLSYCIPPSFRTLHYANDLHSPIYIPLLILVRLAIYFP